MGAGSNPESETAVVLPDSKCGQGYCFEQFNYLLDHAAHQIGCVAVTFVTICGKITLVHASASLTWYLI